MNNNGMALSSIASGPNSVLAPRIAATPAELTVSATTAATVSTDTWSTDPKMPSRNRCRQ